MPLSRDEIEEIINELKKHKFKVPKISDLYVVSFELVELMLSHYEDIKVHTVRTKDAK